MFWNVQRLTSVAGETSTLVTETLRNLDEGRLTLVDETDLKGHHRVDDVLTQALIAWWQRSGLPLRLFMESMPPLDPPEGGAIASLLIDPVDGSLNRDLAVGDPGFVLAVAETPIPTFGDICGGFVLGLRSGDQYLAVENRLSFIPRARSPRFVQCDASVKRLADAILYYNDGYGRDFAHAALHRAGFLPLHVRHHNAFDNTALELAQMCRGAAHLRVEARSYVRNGVRRGSDHANILPAFALGRAAGLITGNLQGQALDALVIDMDRAQDFLVASSPELFADAVVFLADNIGACPLRMFCEERAEPQKARFNVKL